MSQCVHENVNVYLNMSYIQDVCVSHSFTTFSVIYLLIPTNWHLRCRGLCQHALEGRQVNTMVNSGSANTAL